MYLPLYIDMAGRRVIVFGLGKVGRRRAKKLRDSGAEVVGVDRRHVEIGGVDVVRREITPRNIPPLDEYFLVVAATNDRELNFLIAERARAEGALINLVGEFKEGNVIFPAVAETDEKRLSVTTLGNVPSLAKKVKELLEIELSKD